MNANDLINPIALIDAIDRWASKKIVVVGDFMLDQTLFGNAERLSPDAPVPILAIEREEDAPGGASNVSMDLTALRCTVACIGVIGDDTAGQRLRDRLSAAGCDVSGLVVDPSRPTTVKRSYVGLAQHRHPQKMFRVDFESNAPLSDAIQAQLLANTKKALIDADALCLEDYRKGVLDTALCTSMIEAGRSAACPIFVDPAAIDDYSKYRGATVITPNRTETERVVHQSLGEPDQLGPVATRLRRDLDLEAVVLTLDRHGACICTEDMNRVIPTIARHVYDVTGAGDMVLAALTAARCQGLPWDQAVGFANFAAGLEVEKFGCVPIPLEEIHIALLRAGHEQLGKVRTLEQLLPELDAHRRAGQRIAFTNGCFDILHAGHLEVLRGARNQGDLLVLAVNSDASIRSLKGPDRPIVPEKERACLLAELECVDYVILFGDGSGGENDTPIPLLRSLKPDILVKGGTYAHDQVVGWEIVEAYGGRVTTIPPIDGLSTTHIVERIRSSGA